MRVTAVLVAIAACFSGSAAFAKQYPPVSVRVMNLSDRTIMAFTIVGLPFRDVSVDARTTEVLTPAFGDGQMTYDIYWRFADGEMHGANIDLREHLPAEFRGDVFITIHDSRLAVSWSNIDPAWIEYSRVGDPKIVPRPSVPYYGDCRGELLQDPVAALAWEETARAVRARMTADQWPNELTRSRCALDWYIGGRHGDRTPEMNAGDTPEARAQWHRDIEAYKAAHRVSASK